VRLWLWWYLVCCRGGDVESAGLGSDAGKWKEEGADSGGKLCGENAFPQCKYTIHDRHTECCLSIMLLTISQMHVAVVCRDKPVRQCLYGEAGVLKRWEIPPDSRSPEIHLWCQCCHWHDAVVLLPTLDMIEVNVQLSPPHYHNVDRLEI